MPLRKMPPTRPVGSVRRKNTSHALSENRWRSTSSVSGVPSLTTMTSNSGYWRSSRRSTASPRSGTPLVGSTTLTGIVKRELASASSGWLR